MTRIASLIALLLVAGLICPTVGMAARHSLGIGAHYFRSLEEIKAEDDFDEDGLGLNLSYRYRMARLLALQGELQFFPDGIFFAEDAYGFKGFLLLGNVIYAALGIGTNRVEWPNGDKEWTDTEYLLRAGVELPIVPDVFTIDMNANYILADWRDIDDLDDEFDEDYMSFGAAARFHF